MQIFFPFAIQNKKQVLVKNVPIPSAGEGIFSTIKIIRSVPLFLEEHLIRLGLKDKKDFVQKQIQLLLSKNHVVSCAIRISIVNNDIIFHARTLPKQHLVEAITVLSDQALPKVKQIERTIYENALKKAETMHAAEAVFIQGRSMVETTIANIISEDKQGNLITPKLIDQGLRGITRTLLIKKGYVLEKDIPIYTKGPLIAVNSLRVMGIVKLDGSTLITPVPLVRKVDKIIQKEEEDYANSYYR